MTRRWLLLALTAGLLVLVALAAGSEPNRVVDPYDPRNAVRYEGPTDD